MTTTTPTQAQRKRQVGVVLAAASLSALLVASAIPASAAYDPGKPTSSKHQAGDPPPGGGGGGGGATRKVALGVALTNSGSAGVVDAWVSKVGGNKPAMYVLRSAWGDDGAKAFPSAMADVLQTRGITPMVWWTPVDSNDREAATYARHKNITRGDHDAYIRQWARDARIFGGQVLLRFAHEVNSNYFPWSIYDHDNSPATFIDAWRHVHDIFQAEGATNVKFVWSVAKEVCSGGCNPYFKIWPGGQYVDAMGFSAYNWGSQRQWVSMYQTYKRPAKLLPEISNKPIIVTETASSPDGGDKAAWIRNGYREIYDEMPQLSGIVWVDSDLTAAGHPDWSIDSSAASLAAYIEIASLDEFSGKNLFAAARAKKLAERAAAKAKAARANARAAKAKAAKAAEATANDEREPKVEKGTVTSAPKDGGTAGTKAKTTKRPRKKASPPPTTLDSFSR